MLSQFLLCLATHLKPENQINLVIATKPGTSNYEIIPKDLNIPIEQSTHKYYKNFK